MNHQQLQHNAWPTLQSRQRLLCTSECKLPQRLLSTNHLHLPAAIALAALTNSTLQDSICTAGLRTTAGSRVLDSYLPPFDATAVARLKAAGAVLIGKTNLDEFCMGSSTENSAYQVRVASCCIPAEGNVTATGVTVTTACMRLLSNSHSRLIALEAEFTAHIESCTVPCCSHDVHKASLTCCVRLPQVTRNPWDTARVPGGSSGGSAAAVAARQCAAALGSDTGGSIRQPAHFCGVVGLKPSYGRISRFGLIAYGSSLDCIGPLTHSVEDAARLLNVMAGPDSSDATCSKEAVPDFTAQLQPAGALNDKCLAGLRVGLISQTIGEGVAPGVMGAVNGALQHLQQLGAEVEEVSRQRSSAAAAPAALQSLTPGSDSPGLSRAALSCLQRMVELQHICNSG